MKDLSDLLKAGDPLLGSGSTADSLSPEEAQKIRRRMIEAIPAPIHRTSIWRSPFVLAAAVALVVAVSGIAGHRAAAPTELVPIAPAAEAGSSGPLEKRQLQFATPGGTRIIWIFDESLRLQESLP